MKPREWEILKCSNNGDSFIRGDDTKDNEFVHVIEYSAILDYKASLEASHQAGLQLTSENKSLRKERDNYMETSNELRKAEFELEALRKERDEYRAALEFVDRCAKQKQCGPCESRIFAVLAKYPKESK